jgi:hypothetical protein
MSVIQGESDSVARVDDESIRLRVITYRSNRAAIVEDETLYQHSTNTLLLAIRPFLCVPLTHLADDLSLTDSFI